MYKYMIVALFTFVLVYKSIATTKVTLYSFHCYMGFHFHAVLIEQKMLGNRELAKSAYILDFIQRVYLLRFVIAHLTNPASVSRRLHNTCRKGSMG